MLGPWTRINWTWSSRRLARINIDILGISELKRLGMGEFNSDDHYIYYHGQESHRRNGVALIIYKRVQNPIFVCNLKNDRIVSFCFQGKPFNMTVIQVYAPTTDAEAEADQFYEDLEDLLELTLKKKKRCFIDHRGLGLACKSRKPRDTWHNSQVWPWRTRRIWAKAKWILPRECSSQSKHLCQQHKRWLYTWTSPNGQYKNQIDYVLCSWRWRSCIQSAKTRPGADCGSSHQLLKATLRFKLKKWGKSLGQPGPGMT